MGVEYNEILNPQTKKKININSKIGRQIIGKYSQIIGGANAVSYSPETFTTFKSFCKWLFENSEINSYGESFLKYFAGSENNSGQNAFCVGGRAWDYWFSKSLMRPGVNAKIQRAGEANTDINRRWWYNNLSEEELTATF